MYHFSAPMPYTIDDIQKLIDINKQVERSRITSLYACVPRGCELFTGFEQSRNFAFNNTNWDYWKRLINQTFDLGCDFIYLLNSPGIIDIDNPNLNNQLEKLQSLLQELKKTGVKKLRIASSQLMSYIAKNYSDFDILASTSLEYKTIWEYQNFIAFHPEVKQIVPSHDINKNFVLLKNLRKRYPKIEFELMVNEGCLQGCPNRILHEMVDIGKNFKQDDNEYLSNIYGTLFCNKIAFNYPIQSFVIGTHIFPWDIDEYGKIGINKFKLAGRDGYTDDFQFYVNSFRIYLTGVENIKNIDGDTFINLTHHLRNVGILNKFNIKDYFKYLPKIKYFKKYGHLCASRCAVDCRYCYKCADKIQKVFEKKMKETEKTPDYVQACKIAT